MLLQIPEWGVLRAIQVLNFGERNHVPAIFLRTAILLGLENSLHLPAMAVPSYNSFQLPAAAVPSYNSFHLPVVVVPSYNCVVGKRHSVNPRLAQVGSGAGRTRNFLAALSCEQTGTAGPEA